MEPVKRPVSKQNYATSDQPVIRQLQDIYIDSIKTIRVGTDILADEDAYIDSGCYPDQEHKYFLGVRMK